VRKAAENHLARLNRMLRTVSATNAALVRATSEEELLNEMCRVGVELGGYRLSGLVSSNEAKPRRYGPLAWAGEHAEFLQTAKYHLGRRPRGDLAQSGPRSRRVKRRSTRTSRPIWLCAQARGDAQMRFQSECRLAPQE